MKRKELEIKLEKLKGFENPKPRLEQYETPAELASRVLHLASLNGDIRENSRVIDLGCGTGILTIGAAVIGAKPIGIDIDKNALERSRKNSKILQMKKNVEWMRGDIRQLPINSKGYTVLMNPPFGSQNRGADRPFLSAAEKIGKVIYTIHNKGSLKFVEKFINGEITHAYKASIDIPKKFHFHKKKVKETKVEVYRIV